MWTTLRYTSSTCQAAAFASRSRIICKGTSKQILNDFTCFTRSHQHSTQARPHLFSSYFNRSYVPRLPKSRQILWALPFAGGLVLYFTPQNQRLLPSIFSSPHLIPVPPPASQDAAAETKSLMILSPSEASESMSLLQRFIQFLRSRLLDPIATTGRFIRLFFIFVPVVLASPMLLVGSPEVGYNGDKWGAIWWYYQLVAAMQKAGPTFIKVR